VNCCACKKAREGKKKVAKFILARDIAACLLSERTEIAESDAKVNKREASLKIIN